MYCPIHCVKRQRWKNVDRLQISDFVISIHSWLLNGQVTKILKIIEKRAFSFLTGKMAKPFPRFVCGVSFTPSLLLSFALSVNSCFIARLRIQWSLLRAPSGEKPSYSSLFFSFSINIHHFWISKSKKSMNYTIHKVIKTFTWIFKYR